MADALDSKSSGVTPVWVQVPPSVLIKALTIKALTIKALTIKALTIKALTIGQGDLPPGVASAAQANQSPSAHHPDHWSGLWDYGASSSSGPAVTVAVRVSGYFSITARISASVTAR